jgi:hypothetical protein
MKQSSIGVALFAACFIFLSCLDQFWTVKIEATPSSERSVERTALRSILEASPPHNHRREILKTSTTNIQKIFIFTCKKRQFNRCEQNSEEKNNYIFGTLMTTDYTLHKRQTIHIRETYILPLLEHFTTSVPVESTKQCSILFCR